MMVIKCLLKAMLIYWSFPEFMKDFIKEFIPKIILRSKEPFDWDGMVQSRLYFSRLQRKRRKEVAQNYGEVDIETMAETDWRKDAGEKADRIWRWWRPIVATGPISHNFPCYHLVLRLVALVQVSSCTVERVFSQLKYIRDCYGDNIYKDIFSQHYQWRHDSILRLSSTKVQNRPPIAPF
jgi:hypothetical protein